jgi:hypothetical protein
MWGSNRFVNLICGKRKGEVWEDGIKGHVACEGSVMCAKFWSERLKKSNHLKRHMHIKLGLNKIE